MSKISVKLIALAIALFIIFSTLVFALILFLYYKEPDYLSGVGQLAGALFSVWAILGLVTGQIFQYRSIILQNQSLQAQQSALIAELNSLKTSNMSLASETLYNAVIRSQLTFERHARSILVTAPSVITEHLPICNGTLDLDSESYKFASFIVENDYIKDAIERDYQYGFISTHINSYVKLYDNLRQSSQQLSAESGAADIFSIVYESTSISQCYAFFKKMKLN